MKTKNTQPLLAMLLIPALSMLFALPAPSAFAESKEDVLKRIKERYPKIEKARDNQEIGEAWPGNVVIVPEDSSKKKIAADRKKQLEELVKEENDDRKKYFIIVAKESNTTPQKVAERYRKHRFEKADADHWLRKDDKSWVQKKNYKE